MTSAGCFIHLIETNHQMENIAAETNKDLFHGSDLKKFEPTKLTMTKGRRNVSAFSISSISFKPVH